MCILPAQGMKLTAPLKFKKKKKLDVDDEDSDEEADDGDGSLDRIVSTDVRRRGSTRRLVHDEDQIDGDSDLESSSGDYIDTGSECEASGDSSSEKK